MKTHHLGLTCFFITVLVCSGVSTAEIVDPVSPAQWHAMQTAKNPSLSRWLPKRIEQLEAEREDLLRKISILPAHEPRRLPDHLGYHSGTVEPDENGVVPEHWIEVSYRYQTQLHSIALAPAYNPLEMSSRAYAFPKRFRIEVQQAKGQWDETNQSWIQESEEWTEVVNWMEEDFPDPGPYPVFFSDLKQNVVKVRLTVPGEQGDDNATYYALGEIYLFRSIDDEWQLAENVAVWSSRIVSVDASSSLDMPPLWDIRYLRDSLSGLGVPLSEMQVDREDFMVCFGPDCNPGQPVEMVLDLGQTRRIGRVDLWPMKAPQQIALPLFGFPGEIKVELSNDPGFGLVETFVVGHAKELMRHDNLLGILCDGYYARYIRLTFDDLSEYQGERLLGLGEILVSEFGELYPVQQIRARGIPEEEMHQLSRLLDGICRNRHILSEPEWIKGLAQRRPLAKRLAVVEHDLEDTREAWRGELLRLSIWSGGLLCAILVGAMGLQRLQRRRILRTLRTSITRDLHDEVGSGLGGMALKSGVLEDMVGDETVKRELGDLSLMAREISASLREVVWMLDQDRILLPALIDKLIERAQRVVSGVQLSVDRSPELPELEVSLSCKRHIIMFFKEAVHNCARHADATEVTVSVQVDDGRFLRVCIRDNGCGFDPSERRSGWGLENMYRRAKELRGELTLRSAPGEGTLVQLILPLDMLSREPMKAYKTSN